MKKSVLLFLLCITLLSCNDAVDSGDNSPAPIKTGDYELEAIEVIVGDNITSARAHGKYFQQQFHFHEDNTLTIDIISDNANESGSAEANYSVSDSTLTIDILQSTTPHYKEDSTLVYQSFESVNESYSHEFESSDTSFVFNGPGLLLKNQHSDNHDLDNDADTSETVVTTEFYKSGIQHE